MGKQTSIQLLYNKLWETSKDKLTWNSILKDAEEMHKQEIIDVKKNTYTEEQIREAIMWGIENGRNRGCSIYDINKYIQSLKQQ